jgi:hypothetical protein
MKNYAKQLNLENKISQKHADEINEIMSKWEELAYREAQKEMREIIENIPAYEFGEPLAEWIDKEEILNILNKTK